MIIPEYRPELPTPIMRTKKNQYTVSYLGYDVKLYCFSSVRVIPPMGLADEWYQFEKGKLKKKTVVGETTGSPSTYETINTWDHNRNKLSSSINKLNGVIQSQQIFNFYDSEGRPRRVTSITGQLADPGYLERVVETRYEDPGILRNFGLVKEEKETRKENGIDQSRLKVNIFNDSGLVIESYTTVAGVGIASAGQKRNHFTYNYDNAGRMVRATQIDFPGGAFQKDITYQYDSHSGYQIQEESGPVSSELDTKQTQTILDPYTGKLKESSDINGNRLQRRYDSLGRVIEETLPDNTKKIWQYSADLTEVTETYEGRSIRKKIDKLGRVWYIDNPPGEEDDGFDYGPENRVTAIYKGQAPGTWTLKKRLAYDEFGRVTSEEVPGFGITATTYNDATYEIITTDPEGKRSGQKQNVRGQLINSWEDITGGSQGSVQGFIQSQNTGNPAGKLEQTFSYDIWGNTLQTKDERGRLWGASYSAFGEVELADAARFPADLAKPRTRILRDENGVIQNTLTLDEFGNVYKDVSNRYDSQGRLVATLVGNSIVEEIIYDVGLDGESNAKGRIGKVTQIDPPSASNGNGLNSHTVVSDYAYDSFGRITKEKTTIKLTRSGTTLKEHTLKTAYANHGGISEIEYPDGKKIQYTYDTISRRVTGISYNGRPIASYSYNPNNTLSQMVMGNGLTHEYTYDQTHANRRGLIKKIKSRNRTNSEVYFEQDFTYDTMGRIIQTENKDPIFNRRQASSTPQHEVALIKKNYRYTQRDEILAIDLTTEKYTNTATNLNSIQTLTTVKSQGETPERQVRSNAYQYTYDETGNALTYSHASPKQIEQTTRDVNPLKDELIRQTYSDGRQIQLSYDLEGNLTRKIRTYPNTSAYTAKTFKSNNNSQNSKTQTTDYSYDTWSRLTGVTVSGEGKKGTYVYNHKNERVLEVLPSSANHKRFGTGTKVTYWSSQGQAIGEGYIANPTETPTTQGPEGQPPHTNQPKNTKAQNSQRTGKDLVGSTPSNQTQDYTVRYIYSGNQKIAMVRPDKNGVEKIFYFINNAQGTPLYIMDEVGNLVSKIRMDEWGNVASIQGQQSEINYTGKKLDSETGLYYFNQRYYDPEIGRFLTKDPAMQFTNPYIYGGNSPMQYIDPDGEEIITFLLVGAAIGAAMAAYNKDLLSPSTWVDMTYGAVLGAAAAGIAYFGYAATVYGGGSMSAMGGVFYQSGGNYINATIWSSAGEASLVSLGGAAIAAWGSEPMGGGKTGGGYLYEDAGTSLDGSGSNKGARPSTGRVTSEYKKRGERMHTGIDFLPGDGTARSRFSGSVVYIGTKKDGYGLRVIVKNDLGFHSQYSHLESSIVFVSKRVEIGEDIGIIGNSGSQTEAPYKIHLHYEEFLGPPGGVHHFYDPGYKEGK